MSYNFIKQHLLSEGYQNRISGVATMGFRYDNTVPSHRADNLPGEDLGDLMPDANQICLQLLKSGQVRVFNVHIQSKLL